MIRTTLGTPSRMLRKLAGVLGKLVDVEDGAAPSAAAHGGVSGSARSSGGPDADRREKRRSLLAEMLALPPGTQVDIVVDATTEQLTFIVRDLATGRAIRTVPEAEAKALIEQFSRRHGAFVDRSL
ncbi:MAG: hypothetical protein JNM25_16905 [Planctomycetes bacterium]|nr:hypothetical protein [Planctomycetota bacterium]